MVSGEIDGKPCNILLDSGASATVISEKLVSRHKVLSSSRQLFTANGSQLVTKGVANVTMSLGAQPPQRIKVDVARGLPFDCILGVDGLSKFNVTLKFGTVHSACEKSFYINGISDITIGDDMTAQQKSELLQLLDEFQDLFHGKLGCSSVVKHSIRTGEHGPIRKRMYRIPPAKQKVVDQHVQDMLEKQIILPSSSSWSSPIVLVKKRDGKDRFCIDFRAVNQVTQKDSHPLPRIDDLLDRLKGAKYFTTLDLASGFWQIQMDENDRHKTAFSTSNGHYEFNVMPFGLKNAPATFQRMMQTALKDIADVTVYLDDILIFSATWEEHLRTIKKVLIALRKAGLKLQPTKCEFVKQNVEYLGHIIDANGIHPDPKKVSAILRYPSPTNDKQLRAFLGFINYYRRFPVSC